MSPTIARTMGTLRPIAFALAALLASSLPVVCQQPEQPPAEEPAATAPEATPAPPAESEAPAAQQAPAARPVDEQPPATQPQPEVQRPPSGQQPQGQPPGAGQPPPAAPPPAGQPPAGQGPGGPGQRPPQPPLPPRPKVAALHISSPIHVDGVLDDEAWQQAEPATNFVQREPKTFDPATENTEVRIAYTDSTLYVAIRAMSSQPEAVVADEMLRDGALFRDDSVILFFDTFNDNRNAYWFETNANGARTDALITDEGRDFNVQWDAIWDVVAHRTSEGWAAEVAIPFSTLRFDPKQDTWGFQVRRLIRHKSEEVYWAAMPLQANLFRVSLAGDLTGIRGPEPGLNLRLKPFGVGRQTELPAPGGQTVSEDDVEVGVDAKWGITRTMTLDLTYNTDFAETEVDDQQINLTRFSLFLPEKREFFLENSGLFEFGFNPPGTPLLKVFFSRRLGIGPFGFQVPIDWGGRLTGRAGPWSIGMVDVQTEETPITPVFGEPENNWGSVRIKRNIGRRSTVGMIATSREADGDDFNRVIGFDTEIRPTQRTGLSAFYTQSNDPGPSRGDEWSGGTRAFYQNGILSLAMDAVQIGDAYNPEVGFLLRSAIRRYVPRFTYDPRPKNRGKVLNYHFGGAYDLVTDLDDRRESSYALLDFFGLRTAREDELNFTVESTYERLPGPFLISPGVVIPAGEYDWENLSFGFTTNNSRRLAMGGGVQVGGFYDGDTVNGNLTLGIRANRHLRTDTTWIRANVDLPYGDFTTNVIRQRIGVSVTPNLSTNTYIQWNDTAELLSLNLRFNWIYRPGSDIYLIFNQNWNSPSLSDLSTRDRGVILKATYLFEF